MKKIIYSMIIFMLCLGIANAEKCNVISGTGKNIGDEIVCGTEHFYVLENDGNTVKMLAKYNLYIGFNYEYKELDKSFDTEEDAANYAYELYGEEYERLIEIYQDEKGKYSAVLLYKEVSEKEVVKQHNLAIGAHGGEKGEPDPNQIGIISLRDGGYSEPNKYSESYAGGYYYDYTLKKNGLIEKYLSKYNEYLSINNDIYDISILSVQDINNLVLSVTGQQLPLETWGKELSEKATNIQTMYVVGSIKEKIPEKYSWIYSTTYWTRTITRPRESDSFIYFVDTLGDLCAIGSCGEIAGAGLRPVITLSSSELAFKITTQTDGNGTVKSSHDNASHNDKVSFIVTPNEGYEVKEIKVTDSTGKTVKFIDNKFTMPEADVLIEVTFVKKQQEKNPETSDIKTYIYIILIIVSFIITVYNIREYQKIK